jgi:hypothetical protein
MLTFISLILSDKVDIENNVLGIMEQAIVVGQARKVSVL